MRRIACLACLGALLALPSAAAAEPRLTVSRSAAEPGQRVLVVGHGFARAAPLRVRLGGTLVKRARTGQRGGFRVRITVPSKEAGRYRLAARSRGRLARRFFRIRAAVALAPAPDPQPPAQENPAPVSTPPPPPPPPPPRPTLVAAGDIACRPDLSVTEERCRQAGTAARVESLAPDAVAVLGDIQYEHGEIENFIASYDPTWGRFKAITWPAVGNHEYEGAEPGDQRDSAEGYFTYFGDRAGDPAKGYYRWSLGDWTLFVLNSGAIDYTRTGGGSAMPDDCWPVSCAEGSAQETWLRDELEALPDDACVLAYWHHPRYSSGYSGDRRDYPETRPLYDALHEHGAELVLTGHAHNYERFAPMDGGDAADSVAGITQFVVGTGGRSLFPNTGDRRETSAQLYTDAFGVLELTLAEGAWSSRFVTESGEVRDSTSGTCHSPPPAP